MSKQNSGPRQETAAATPNINTPMIVPTTDKRATLVVGSATERVRNALEARGCRPRGNSAHCPAHDDQRPSLSINPASRVAGVVLHCQVGCTPEAIVAALGLTMTDLFDKRRVAAGYVVTAEYPYTDETGEVLFVKERREPKDFRCKLPGGGYGIGDVRRVLYRLPEVLEAVRAGHKVYVVEGENDADALAALGLAATCNFDGASGPGQASKWRPEYGEVLRGADVVVIADNDRAGRAHAAAILADLTSKAASVVVLEAAVGKDVSDHLAAGKSLEDLVPAAVRVMTLGEVHKVFRRWLGTSYDLEALDVVLSAAAVERLDGDPVWLLIISGSGNAKTETVLALGGAGAHVTSTITSEGALISATSKKDASRQATGGLLRKIGARGVLVIKDFTSILSMNRDSRAAVLAALREVYDGRWERNVGTDGGQSLAWEGRIVLIGAVTTAYDSAHAVIASMGDRFALVRVDSSLGRMQAGRQALQNVGREDQMRPELATAVGELLLSVRPELAVLDDQAMTELLGAANLVTLSRTAVERDNHGNVLEAHAPEAPTRFAKMLAQVVRGALSLGVDRQTALRTALRVAGDSVPPLRLGVLSDLLDHPDSRTADVVRRLQRPRSTVDRTLQELHQLGLVVVREEVVAKGAGSTTVWHYSLHTDVDRQVLRSLLTRNVTTPGYGEQEGGRSGSQGSTDIPGDPSDFQSQTPRSGHVGQESEPASDHARPPLPPPAATTTSGSDTVPSQRLPEIAPTKSARGHEPTTPAGEHQESHCQPPDEARPMNSSGQQVLFGDDEERRIGEVFRQLEAQGLGIDGSLLAERLRAQNQQQPQARRRLVQLLELPRGAESAAPWTTAPGREASSRLAGPAWPCQPNGGPIISLKSLTSPLAAQGGPYLEEVCGLIRELIEDGPTLRCLERNLVGERIHPRYSTDTDTGRLTSREPNVLGFGHRTEKLLADRDLIIAKPGDVFIGADLAGIDARAVAGLSGDLAYAALFETGRDIHVEMSLLFFGDQDHREPAKAITHGLPYGRGAQDIANQSEIPIEEVREKIAVYFQAFPGIVRWQNELRTQATAGHRLSTGTGRWVTADPGKIHTTAPGRVAQGCARDLAMVGLLRLVEERWLPYVRLFLHDEIILSVPEAAAEEVVALLLEFMSFDWQSPSGLTIPIVAHPAKGYGPRWSDLYR